MKEETGLDITELLVEDDRIERHIKQQRSKLFIITGVSCFFLLEAWSDQSWQVAAICLISSRFSEAWSWST